MFGLQAVHLIAFIVVYLSVVRLLRYQGVKATHGRYHRYTIDANAMGRLPLQDAFDIQLRLVQVEFPTTFSVSVFFALFKVGVGIPPFGRRP
jgi:hypothetical protein